MPPHDRGPLAPWLLRAALGGVLMGLANLVPGISGGTMLLAAGVYPLFVEAVAEITTFRFRLRSLLLLGAIALAAALAIGLLAGPVKHLVETRRWVMYSLFIGLTLGGVPIVVRMARPLRLPVHLGAAAGLSLMLLLTWTQAGGARGGGWILLFAAGAAGASAMILPGVSGAYLLLVLGQYERILGAVDRLKQGLGGASGAVRDALPVLVPVGIGVAAGIVGVSNLVRYALRRWEAPTLGFLLGLLFGSVPGIWPFQEPAAHGAPRVFFAPGPGRAAAALGLVLAGLALTLLIDRLGAERR